MAYGRACCLELETGKLLWQGGDFGEDGSCVATSDGRLIILGKGVLALADTAEHSPAQYRELARVEALPKTVVWPHVVFAGGRVYCKNKQGRLICYSVAP